VIFQNKPLWMIWEFSFLVRVFFKSILMGSVLSRYRRLLPKKFGCHTQAPWPNDQWPLISVSSASETLHMLAGLLDPLRWTPPSSWPEGFSVTSADYGYAFPLFCCSVYFFPLFRVSRCGRRSFIMLLLLGETWISIMSCCCCCRCRCWAFD